jgi:hypothetical protein
MPATYPRTARPCGSPPGTLVDVKTYTLLDGDGRPLQSSTPGTLGGHRRSKIYGRLDCPTALRWIAKGQYVQHRVFFADEETAVAAGYRPCGHCLRARYREWLAG